MTRDADGHIVGEACAHVAAGVFEDSEANARLFASAPGLAEELVMAHRAAEIAQRLAHGRDCPHHKPDDGCADSTDDELDSCEQCVLAAAYAMAESELRS